MSRNGVHPPIEILLVEDSEGDAELARGALAESKVLNTIHLVTDGEEAMAFLRREGKHARAVRPDLILLDLNLPRKSGMEVLADIKGDEELRRIPVVILTCSKADEDVVKSYDLHANCFITKPIDLKQFLRVVSAIEEFWLAVVKLPPKRP